MQRPRQTTMFLIPVFILCIRMIHPPGNLNALYGAFVYRDAFAVVGIVIVVHPCYSGPLQISWKAMKMNMESTGVWLFSTYRYVEY